MGEGERRLCENSGNNKLKKFFTPSEPSRTTHLGGQNELVGKIVMSLRQAVRTGKRVPVPVHTDTVHVPRRGLVLKHLQNNTPFNSLKRQILKRAPHPRDTVGKSADHRE